MGFMTDLLLGGGVWLEEVGPWGRDLPGFTPSPAPPGFLCFLSVSFNPAQRSGGGYFSWICVWEKAEEPGNEVWSRSPQRRKAGYERVGCIPGVLSPEWRCFLHSEFILGTVRRHRCPLQVCVVHLQECDPLHPR